MNVVHKVTVTVPMEGGGCFARQWLVDSQPLPEDMLALLGLPGARTHWPIPDAHPGGRCTICEELAALAEVGDVCDAPSVNVASEQQQVLTAA